MSAKGEKKRRKRPAPTAVLANVSNTRFTVVRKCCEELGYRITESITKNLLFWCDTGGNFEFASSLCPWQFYNHFPGTWAIARKVDLARNIEKMARLLPEFYTFHPKSFIIPCQTCELQNHLNSIARKSKRTFIVKPDRGSLGKGIVLIQDASAVDDMYESAIAQQYIPPYLIDGLKFDLRVYALVSSVEPLRIYIHEEGLARFCTEPYVKPSGNNLELSFAHLTNYSLNKNNPHFEQPTDAEHADCGHKRSMTSVFKVMEERGVNVEGLKAEIENIVRLTVISIQPYVVTSYRTAIPLNDGKSRCFEILGFDILIDKHAHPWLLEVNWAPSLASDSPFDVAVKSSVVKGALKIININPNFKRIVMNRRKLVSQQRASGNLWDANEELRLSKETQYRLIYPLPKEHPRYKEAEMAFAESKASPVGASIQPARAKARKEALIAQFRAEEQAAQPKVQPRVIQQPKPVITTKRKVISPLPKSHPVVRSLPGTIKQSPTAPIIQSRVTQVLPQPVSEDAPLCLQFRNVMPDMIDEAEERERLRLLRKQCCTAQLLCLSEKIARLLKVISPQTARSIAPRFCPKPNAPPAPQANTKQPGVVYAKYQITCGTTV